MNWKKKKDNPEAQAPEAAAAGKGPAAFWKKNWKLLVPAVCVIVAGGAFLLWPKQAKPASVDASYTEAAPEYRNVSNTLSGTGTLNPANTYTVKSLVDGKVLTPAIFAFRASPQTFGAKNAPAGAFFARIWLYQTRS